MNHYRTLFITLFRPISFTGYVTSGNVVRKEVEARVFREVGTAAEIRVIEEFPCPVSLYWVDSILEE
jgi:hypothetical protein